MVSVVVVSAYGLASLGRNAELPADIRPLVAGTLGLFFFIHLAVRRLAFAADPVLVPTALLLNGIGYVMIARLGSDVEGGGDLAGLPGWSASRVAPAARRPWRSQSSSRHNPEPANRREAVSPRRSPEP